MFKLPRPELKYDAKRHLDGLKMQRQARDEGKHVELPPKIELKRQSTYRQDKVEPHWSSHARVQQYMFPVANKIELQIAYFDNEHKRYPLTRIRKNIRGVKGDFYNIYVGETQPSFVFLSEGPEMLQRMVLRACLSQDMEDFALKKSNV